MRYSVLGPLRIAENGTECVISARKVEVLLATLIIHEGQVISMDQLIGEIWPERPPRRAVAALHVYVCTLRKLLNQLRDGRPSVLTSPPGYVLELGTDEADFRLFLDLLGRGRTALRGYRFDEADELLEGALALWRGPVFAGHEHGPMMSEFARSLTERRTECLELYVETKHRMGEHRQTVGLLYSLIDENPFHENFYRQLMLALYHANRKADALEVYRSAHRLLLEELGLPPCDAVRDLHHAILADDLGMLSAARTSVSKPRGMVGPRG